MKMGKYERICSVFKIYLFKKIFFAQFYLSKYKAKMSADRDIRGRQE